MSNKNKPKIASVTNSIEKGANYALSMRRYNKAIAEGFYFEAMLIEYAMVEDRLRSFLYHAGVLHNRTDTKGFKKTKSQILAMLKEQNAKAQNTSVVTISAKIQIIRAILNWKNSLSVAPTNDKYLETLWNQIGSRLTIDEVSETLVSLEDWCAYRNEIIHALMNKNLDAVDESISERCERGMNIVRSLDRYVKQVRFRNVIRRSLRIKVD